MTTCQHPNGCPHPVVARGWCSAHYQRWITTGDVGPLAIKRVRPDGVPCAHPDGCPRPVTARGLCNTHYLRLTIHGDLGPSQIRDTRPAPRLCALEGCGLPRLKRDWCGTHYERWRVHGDASVTHHRRGATVVRVSGVGRGTPGYLALHKRVYRRKGKATEQTCAHCGAQAMQWAYDHNDADERTGPMIVRGEVFELRYSTDPAHYIPLCIPCHRRFDAAVPA